MVLKLPLRLRVSTNKKLNFRITILSDKSMSMTYFTECVMQVLENATRKCISHGNKATSTLNKNTPEVAAILIVPLIGLIT